jgi:hypothetical protein
MSEACRCQAKEKVLVRIKVEILSKYTQVEGRADSEVHEEVQEERLRKRG